MLKFFISQLILILLFSTAEAKVYKIRWGVNLDPIDYFVGASKQFKTAVEKRTNGNVKVKVIFNQFTPDRCHLNDITNKTYSMGQIPMVELASSIPAYRIWDLPFLFEDDAHVTRYFASPEAKMNVAEVEKLGVTALGYTYSGGFLSVYGEKQMNSFNDFKNEDVALEAKSSFLFSSFKDTFNLTNYPLEHSDILQKQRTNSPVQYAEAVSSSLNMVFDYAQTLPKFVHKTDHRVLARVLVIDTAFLNSLPEEYRQIVIEEGFKAANRERELSIADKVASFAHISDLDARKKLVFNIWTDKQKKEERALFKKMYDQFSKEVDPKAIDAVDSLRAKK